MIIRIFILSFIMLSGIIGCAKITYKNDEFVYRRWGRQSIDGLEVHKLSDGTIAVKIDKQSGDSGKLTKAISDAAKILAGATGMKLISP